MGEKMASPPTINMIKRLTNVSDLLDDGIENNSDLTHGITDRVTIESVSISEIVPEGLRQETYKAPLGVYGPRFYPSARQVLHGKFASKKIRFWHWVKAAILFLFVWVPASYESFKILAEGGLSNFVISSFIIVAVSVLVFYEPYVMFRGQSDVDRESCRDT